MTPKITIDTRNFNRAVRELSRRTGVSMPGVVDAEAQKILEAAIRYTPAAKVASIRSASEKRQWGVHKTGYVPKTPFRGSLSRGGGKTYHYANRYPNALWAAISAQRKASLQKRLERRGLSKASWSALAREAGLAVALPAYASRALSKNRYSGNATATRRGRKNSYFLTFTNRQPTVNLSRVGGRSALLRAINGRTKFFERNLRKGTFDDMQKVARAYPGLKVGS